MSLNSNVSRLFAAGLVILLTIPASAQTPDGESKDPMRSGVWALQFRVTSNFTLGSFSGSVVSAKYHLQPNRALRFGLRAGGQITNDEVTESSNASSGDLDKREGGDSGVTQELDTFDVGLEAQYVFYPSLSQEVLFYWGLGPSAAWFVRETERRVNDPASQTTSSRIERRTGQLAGHGLFGAEWFAASHISLTAEYGLTLGRFWSTDVERVSDESTGQPARSPIERRVNGSGWTLGGSAVRFGITLYLN